MRAVLLQAVCGRPAAHYLRGIGIVCTELDGTIRALKVGPIFIKTLGVCPTLGKAKYDLKASIRVWFR
jgi:hypothetical protein